MYGNCVKKIDTLQVVSEIYTPNGEYENFVHMEAATECLPTNPISIYSMGSTCI